MSADAISGYLNVCGFDMCALEGNSLQETIRCDTYYVFNQVCTELGIKLGKNWSFNWRPITKCRKSSLNLFRT